MTRPDLAHVLAELAAIQREVTTVILDENLALLEDKSERALDRIKVRITALMASIEAARTSAPTTRRPFISPQLLELTAELTEPADNGMLGPVHARIDAVAADVQSVWNMLSKHADAIAELRGNEHDHG